MQEVIEMHHNQKLDAPSGTALALADACNEALDNKYEYCYGRADRREKRPKNEIGISAVRGGNIVGEHEVIFAGLDEVINISHSARSKSLFAVGAVNAAVYLNGKQLFFGELNVDDPEKQEASIPVQLKKGRNIMVARVDHTEWDWIVGFKFLDKEGNAL